VEYPINVVTNLYDFLSSVEHDQIQLFEDCFISKVTESKTTLH